MAEEKEDIIQHQESTTLPAVVDKVIGWTNLKKFSPFLNGIFSFDQLKTFLNLIPGIGGFVTAQIGVMQNIRLNSFFKKFAYYIYGIRLTPDAERIWFEEQLSQKAEDGAGDIIMGIIDRLDNVNKSSIIANLTIACIERYISIEDFFRLSSMVERIPYVDFDLLLNYQKPYFDPSGDTYLLYATGALVHTGYNFTKDQNMTYALSPLGILLVRYGLNKEVILEGEVYKMSLDPETTDGLQHTLWVDAGEYSVENNETDINTQID